MLETDCMIPYKPVPIPHREFYALHGDALSVKTLIDNGLGKWEIIKKLRISEDAYNDAVYEINKQNAVTELNQYFEKEKKIMPRGEKLDAETVERIRELKAAGKTVKEIMETVGCGRATVGRVCKKDKPAEIEPVTEPVVMNEEHTAEIPEDVLTAVRDAIDYEEETVEDHLRTIKELQHEIEQRRTKAAIMRKWLEDCGYESTAD